MGDYQIDELASRPGYSSFSRMTLRNPLIRPSLLGSTVSRLGHLAMWTNVHIKHILNHENHNEQILSKLQETFPTPPFARQEEAPIDDKVLDKMLELKQVIAKSNEVLASAKTVWPMTLFRDDMVVDRSKVTITKRSFFFVSEVMSIRVEDILNVKASLGPFFGSITIAVRVLSTEDHHTINFFWREDAVHMKHLIQGYIIARHNDIDCKDQNKEDLIATLTELGHDSSFK